jgi:hypothetical protein
MTQEPGSPDSGRPKRGLLDELQSLILSLQSLATEVASRVLAGRMQTKRHASTARDGLPIGKLVADRIAPKSAASVPADPAPAQEVHAPAAGHEPGASETPAPEPTPTPTERIGFTLLNAFSEHLNRHRSESSYHPLLRDQMREHTFAHLNKALSLARQGNADGAKLYATLAENAMGQAGEYMSDDEYRAFRKEVEERLHSGVQ